MKIPEQLRATPHRRFNALTREWVLVSPHRTQRPWQGQVEEAPRDQAPEYDPQCYLCPGNERAGGKRNPKYDSTFVFENDFAALNDLTPHDVAENVLKHFLVLQVVHLEARHDLVTRT